MHEDTDKRLMRAKDIVLLVGGILGIVGFIMGIYVHPIDARLSAHISKNEPEIEQLKQDVAILKTQFTYITLKLDNIEKMVKREFFK